MQDVRERFSILDWIGFVWATGATVALLSFPFAIAPVWRSMLADMGGTMPAFTELVLSSWFTPLIAASAAILLLLGFRKRSISLQGARMLVLAAFILSSVGAGLTVAGMYQPVIRTAEALQP